MTTINGKYGQVTLKANGNPYVFTDNARITMSKGVAVNGLATAPAGGWSVTNDGVIDSTGIGAAGVDLSKGELTNAKGATIEGTANTANLTGVDIVGDLTASDATVVNSGAIKYFKTGVLIDDVGTVENRTGGTISGGLVGVDLGANPYNLSATGGASLVNYAGATISGENGVATGGDDPALDNNAVVTNSGSIKGTTANFQIIDDEEYNYGFGVVLSEGGTVSNTKTGVIHGAVDGVWARNVAVQVYNSHVITGVLTGVDLGFDPLSNKETVGGDLTNYAGATISGANGVVCGGDGVVTAVIIINEGTIEGTTASPVTINGQKIVLVGDGVTLLDGGNLTNAKGATISGKTDGVWALNGNAAVDNSGKISGAVGVNLGVDPFSSIVPTTGGGGVLTNEKGATIAGYSGVTAGGGFATVTNDGAIRGIKYVALKINKISYVLGEGVALTDGGTVTNEAKATISGALYGVSFSGGSGAVTNAGTISGTKASIVFNEADNNTLTLQTGSTLSGAVKVATAGGTGNALTLQGTGTAGNKFENFNTLTVGDGATPGVSWTLGGTFNIGATTLDDGALNATGELTSAFTIEADGQLRLGVAAGSSADTVAFSGKDAGTLIIGTSYAGTISGFDLGDGIIFRSDAYSTADTIANEGGNIWSVLNVNNKAIATFTMSGGLAADNFTLGAAVGGGLEVGYTNGPGGSSDTVNATQYLAEQYALDQDPNGFTVSDTAANLETLAGELTGKKEPVGLGLLIASDGGALTFTAAESAALATSGLFVNSAGGVTEDFTDGGSDVTTGDFASESLYGAKGVLYATAENNANQETLTLSGVDVTVTTTSQGLETAVGKDVSYVAPSDSFPAELINAQGNAGETFSFSKIFGDSELQGFRLTGSTAAPADTLELDASMFGLTSTNTASDLSALINNGDVIISGTTITITDGVQGESLAVSTGTTPATSLALSAHLKFF